MPAVQRGPVFGLIAQVVLLAGLAASVGLSGAGWVAGTAWGLVVFAALSRGLAAAGARALGAANRVTLARATLVGGVTALVADALVTPPQVSVLVALSLVALVLDGVDGQVARRTGTVSALGARFDMEVDAFLILVLSVHVAQVVGPWVLAIGLARYLAWAGARAVPWMRVPVPPRYWRKPVAAIQGIVLTAAVAGQQAGVAIHLAIIVAMILLAESFGRDVAWQWRRRRLPRSGRGESAELSARAGREQPSRPDAG